VAAGDGREGYWRAEYPDGRVGFFGAEPSGALVPEARVGGPDGTFRYHLVATIDVHGHELRYRYQRDGQVALARALEYVFRGPTPRYAVELEYEARPDHIIDAKPGFELRLTRRLSAIRVRVRGEQLRRYA